MHAGEGLGIPPAVAVNRCRLPPTFAIALLVGAPMLSEPDRAHDDNV